MGDTEELLASVEAVLLAMVEEGELELATRRGASSIGGPLLTLLEMRADDLRAGRLDLCDWLLDRREVVELYVDGPAVAARLAPVLARLAGDEAPPQHDADLAAAIARDPDDVAARAVYADWLSERGDPRGDLIAVQIALAERPDDARLCDRETRLLAEHRTRFLGQLSDDPDVVRVRFRLGWLDDVWVGREEPAETLAELATLESARFLRRLTVHGWRLASDAALYTEPTLRFGGEYPAEGISVLERVELAWLDPAPRLERLEVWAHHTALGRATFPSLKWLRCVYGTVDLTGLVPSTA